MNTPQVLGIGRELFYTAMLLALPTLLASLIVGLIVSIFQTVTSIQEQTLTFVPRLLIVGVVLALTIPWALEIALQFTVRMLMQAAEVTK